MKVHDLIAELTKRVKEDPEILKRKITVSDNVLIIEDEQEKENVNDEGRFPNRYSFSAEYAERVTENFVK